MKKKSQLFPTLSIGEKAEADFWEYLKELEKEKYVFFLPVRLIRAKLANIGTIKNITIDFERFNLIIGKGATGKTTIIRSIAYIFWHKLVKDYFSDKATIELDVLPEKKYKISMVSYNGKENIKCVLVDCGGSRFDTKYFEKFLFYLKRLDMQVIMTESRLRGNISYGKINTIELPTTTN